MISKMVIAYFGTDDCASGPPASEWSVGVLGHDGVSWDLSLGLEADSAGTMHCKRPLRGPHIDPTRMLGHACPWCGVWRWKEKGP